MQLLARQEDRLPCLHRRLAILGPHVTLAREDDDRLLVKMAVRGGLGAGDMAYELGDEPRADAFVDQELAVARSHRRALAGIDRDHALRMDGIEALRHGGRPLELSLR